MSEKRLTLKEFRELGLLQEINRQLLHPMGLALGIMVNTDDDPNNQGSDWNENEFKVFVMDGRDDPEGWMFGDYDTEERYRKMKSVKDLFETKREYREKNLGWHVQPVEEKK